MKKNYYSRGIQLAMLTMFSLASRAQILTPYSGSNSIPAGTVVTLCSHAGCGTTYADNASGYTVIYAGQCAGINISGTYDTESCCDAVNIYDGVGTGGTLLQNLFGNGSINYTGAVGQTLTVEFTSDGSVDKTGFQFTVNSGPGISINAGVTDYTLCTGIPLNLAATGADSYYWSTGSALSSILITPFTPTVYTVSGINNLYPLCTLTNTVNIAVKNSPTVAITGSSIRCGNTAPVILNVGGIGADTYMWSTGSANTTVSVSPLFATMYYVVATNTLNGCTATKSITVNYSPNPVVSVFSPTTTVCEGENINIFASGADTYTWSNSLQGALITISPQSSTSYSVLGQNSYGCSGLGTLSITVNPLPAVLASASKGQVCPGETLTLTATGANMYVWMSNAFNLTSAVTLASPQTTTNYTVTGTDANGCSKSATVTVNVTACTGFNEITSSANTMRVYPNPANNDLTVEFDDVEIKDVMIMDLTGRIVQSSTDAGNKVNFDISGLANGIYYVRTKSATSANVTKIIKQ